MNVSSTPSFLRFSFATDSQRDALLSRLTQGQTLQARVLDQVSEGRWAVRVFGHTLVAESRLSLGKGQVVEARVQDLGPPLTLSILGKPGSESGAVRDALGRLGVPADARSESVIRALIARGLPVDRERVMALRDLLGSLSGAAEGEDLTEVVGRILFLQSRGMPVNPSTLAAYLSQVPSGALAALLEGLGDLLQDVRAKRLPAETVQALTDRLRGLIRDASALSPTDLREAIRGLGLDLEGRLAALALEDPTGAPTGLSSLRLVLLRLQTLVDAEEGSQVPAELRERLGELVRHLDTMQVSSLPGRLGNDVAFQLPLAFDGETTTADIRISRREGEDGYSVDPESTRIVISLTLSELGPIRVDLTVAGHRAGCAIEVENADVVPLFEAVAEELTEALVRATAGPVEVRVRKANVESVEPPPPTVGVDFRA